MGAAFTQLIGSEYLKVNYVNLVKVGMPIIGIWFLPNLFVS